MAQPRKSIQVGKVEGNAYRAAFDAATRHATATETLARCAELEAAVEALRVRYEQYFLGLTRRAPAEDHALVRSALIRLRQSFVRNTSARFRMQSLWNRFLSYERLWERTCREIEEGTYRRDLFKARMRRAPQSEDDRLAARKIEALRRAQGEATDEVTGEDDFEVDEEAPIPAANAGPAAGTRRAHAPPARGSQGAPLPGIEEAQLRKVYDAFIGAKKRCRENVDGLSYEAVQASLRKQVPALLERHGASRVDLKVVIKGGKAVLKAVPR